MPYAVETASSAERELKRLPADVARRIGERIKRLANNPRPRGAKKLRDSPFYRLRIGDYRVIYEVNDTENKVAILRIRHRREAYR